MTPLPPRRTDAIVVRRGDVKGKSQARPRPDTGQGALDPEKEGRMVQIDGEDALLVERLRGPLRRALGSRGAFYSVRVDTVGRVGEILVSITGSKGRLPLLLGQEELDAGYVFRVVSDTVRRYGL